MKDLPIFQIPFPNSHNSSMMEVKDFEVEVRDREVSSNGTQDSEVDLLQDTDEDELRKTKSKARWDEEMRMAEVLEKKGRCWATTGIIRNSKTYLSIEET
ncbi:hypothetical protein MKW94_006997, partial [Papaver nudicaule]|nr:hypothetical protein [Papaver nudicaule]